MAERSTRNKIRWHCEAAITALDKAMSHLQLIDEHAAYRSEYINHNLPLMVAAITELQSAIKRFWQGL